MEEGSKGDVSGLIRYLGLRLEITGFIVKNPELLKGDLTEVQRHVDRLNVLFNQVKELCQFNEVEVRER